MASWFPYKSEFKVELAGDGALLLKFMEPHEPAPSTRNQIGFQRLVFFEFAHAQDAETDDLAAGSSVTVLHEPQ